MAQVSATVYGLSSGATLPAARLRSETMAFRDARRDRPLTDDDWGAIEAGLVKSWTLLQQAVRRR